MKIYEARILNGLLDSYEKSLLSRGLNKISIRIGYSITKKTMPEYFNESSLAYEDIHACIGVLKEKGFLHILWKKGKENHIVEKLFLNENNVAQIYKYTRRIPKMESETSILKSLQILKKEYKTPVASSFIEYLIQRLEEGKSVKDYVKLQDVKDLEKLLYGIFHVETNTQTCYIREFSIVHFSDSKIFEAMLGILCKVFKQFDQRFKEADIREILAEYYLYHTPNYVYLKGAITLYFSKDSHEINLEGLSQGIGISGEDIDLLRLKANDNIKKVITIENQTAFFSWWEEESIILYLGGYHNQVRRKLLQLIYSQIPDAEYLHFGDIDVGGFEIYDDLCRKTEISFSTYYMGIEELKMYTNFTKPLSDGDRKRLERLIEKKEEGYSYLEVLKHMKQYGVKLEQECVKREWYKG